MDGIKLKSSGQCAPDGHATGLLGLPAVLGRLSDPSHRCQGPELTCLLQALCKQLITAAADTNLVIFTSADRARTTAAQAAAADVSTELSIGAPERCIPSPQSFISSALASSYNMRANTEVEALASAQTLPSAAGSTNSTPLALPALHQPLNRAAATAVAATAAAAAGSSRAEALAAAAVAAPPAASRRPLAAPGNKTATQLTTATTAAPLPAVAQPPQPTLLANANTAAAATLAGLSPAATDPSDGLAGLVTAGIALLVDHLEHFHYRAKAVVLDGLLSLSAIGLGPDRRLDAAGIASLPLPSGGVPSAPSSSAAAVVAAAAAMAAAAAGVPGGQLGDDPAAVADAVQALGGLGLGDWLALRIISAGAMPRLLEMLTQRTGMNFVPVRQLASQVVHNLARRRNPAVRTALARWRPLPGLISALDVVLEDSPDIAARLLLVLSDLFPITCHQIAGALHKLISKQQDQPTGPAGGGNAGGSSSGGGHQHVVQPLPPPPPQPQPQPAQPLVACQPKGPEAFMQQQQQQQQGGAGSGKARSGTAAEAQLPLTKGRRAKAQGAEAAAAAAAAAGGGGGGGGGGRAIGPSGGGGAMGVATAVAASSLRSRRGAAVAAAPLGAAAAVAIRNPAVMPEPAHVAAAAALVPAAADSASTNHLGLAPDVDVPLEALLMRVTGYYMRLAYSAVLSPAPLSQPPGVKPPYGEAERRECEKALLTQKVEEHRRRRKEAAQLDCCVAALLAAAPMPSCLFDALSYSYTRAFAVLAGPPPQTTSLTSTANGGLWRAQDLLPYALNLIQSLGGGSDSGEGGSAAAVAVAGRGAGALAASTSSSSIVTSAAATLAFSSPGGAAAGTLLGGSTAAVAAALDRTWGLHHHHRHPSQGSSTGGGDVTECPGPALPSAPYGDKPVSGGLLDQCSPVLRVVLERAVQAAHSLPAAAAPPTSGSNAAAVPGAAAAMSAAAMAAVPAAADLLAARVEAVPMAVLRSVGVTFLSITRPQVALKLISFGDSIKRLTAVLARHTEGAAAGVAQARMALGLVNLWACAGGGAACLRPPRSQQTTDDTKAVPDVAPAAPKAVTITMEAASAVDNSVKPSEKPSEAPQLRRSARIKRRRECAAAQAQVLAIERKDEGLEGRDPPSAACASGTVAAQAAASSAAATAAIVEIDYSELLETLVDMLTVRISDARFLQDLLDLQLRQQQLQQQQSSIDADAAAVPAAGAQGANNALAAPLNAAAAAAASGAAGAWLAAVSSAATAATAITAAERAKLVLETQAVLLQAVALILPSLDAAAASKLVNAGAVHSAARLARAAATAALPAAAVDSSRSATVTLTPAETRPHTTSDVPANNTATGVAAAMDISSRDGHEQWNEEPLHGVTAVQALGLALELLRVSGAGAYGCGGLQQADALAALGGVLLLRRPTDRLCCGQLPSSQPAVAAAAAAEAVPSTSDSEDRSAEEPTTRIWELLKLMSAGEAPCAGHDIILQLLGPLVSLTHGSNARCAGARAGLIDVLLQVLRWSHSNAQRRRLMVQVLVLWAPHLQAQFLRLPRIASPMPAPRALPPMAVAAVNAVVSMDGPLALAAAAAAAAATGENKLGCNFGRTTSQSTMPYMGSRGGRLSTPVHGIHGPLNTGGNSGALMHPGQRTPPWGGCVGAAATAAGSGSVTGSAVHAAAVAAAAQVISPTRHFTSVSGLRTAVPAAPNPGRGRRGSRLAAGLTSPLPLQAPREVGFQGCDSDPGVVAVVTAPSSSADAVHNSITVETLCGFLEAIMERLVDGEVVRHLHMTGWLRALNHGAHCADAAVRESCLRCLTFTSRALGSVTPPWAGPSSFRTLPLLLTELEGDIEIRNQLSALDPGAATVLGRRQEVFPPRGPNGLVGQLPRGSVTAAAAAHHSGPCWPSHVTGGDAVRHFGDGGAVPPLASPQAGLLAPLGGMHGGDGGANSGGVEAEVHGLPPGGEVAGKLVEPVPLPLDVELVLPPPSPQKRLQVRRGARRRGATVAAAAKAAKAATRARKGTGGAAQEVAAATAVTVSAPAQPATEAIAPSVPAAQVPSSRRTRPRKSTTTRKVRSAVVVGEDGAIEPPLEAPLPQPPPLAVETVSVSVLAPGQLVSPVSKRRRISEFDEGESTGHRRSSTGPAAMSKVFAAAADGAAEAKSGLSAGELSPCRGRRPTQCLMPIVKEVVDAPMVVGCGSGPGSGSGSVTTCPGASAAAAAATAAAAVGRIELQLTEREKSLAAAVRSACMALESALAARRHDLAALRTADQAAAAAAAAAATMAAAAAATAPAPEPSVSASEDAATTQGGKKKASRLRAASGATSMRSKQAAAAAAVAPSVQQPVAEVPPAAVAAQPPVLPAPVPDDVFLSRTYRGISKRLNFDDL